MLMAQPLSRPAALRLAAPTEADLAALPALLTAAFGPGRFAKTSERVREQGARLDPALSRVAFDEHRILGCCLLSHVMIGAAPALFLGPLAVHPRAQKGGIGAALVAASLEAARDAGADAVILVGAPAFFAPFGFAALPKGRVVLPGPVDPGRFLGLSLKPHALEALEGAVSGFPAASPA
jgi:predicted N-acetyltransferase YhbS